MEGPPNTLRRDRAYASVTLIADVDPDRPYVRLQIGTKRTILREGEWSVGWPPIFRLVPHVASVRGMFRVFAKQLHPRFELYVSPINVDPDSPALPISTPASYAARSESGHRGCVDAGHWRRYLGAAPGSVRSCPNFLSKADWFSTTSGACWMTRCGDSPVGCCSSISRRSIRIRMCCGVSTKLSCSVSIARWMRPSGK